jgi:tRNA/rRNA methyltransferase
MPKTNNTPIVLLVRPQLGDNIGAVARAMSNFGLSELRLVAPRGGWPNAKALEVASGAAYIIEAAKCFPSFAAATADIQLLYATTARPRDMEKRVVEPAAAMGEIHERIDAGSRVAIVFGPERTGLENEDITLCDTIITIPTGENPSLNIAQSSVIVAYEWLRQKQSRKQVVRDLPEPAQREEWQGLFSQLEEYLDVSDYFRGSHKKTVMWQNLQNMILRGGYTDQEVRTMRGVLRALWERRRTGPRD